MGLFLVAPALALDCPDGGREPVEVVAVSARLDLRLVDGRQVYFPALEPPRASLAEPGRPQAIAADLLALLGGKTLGLQPLGIADRWGRVPARLFLPDQDESLDEILLAAGLAQRGAGAAPCSEAARAAETAARAAGLGLWSDVAFAPLASDRPGDFAARAGTLALIEGPVTSVGRTSARLYLNFGRGRGGVFASIARRNWAAFARAGFSEERLRGRNLRLRGIIEIDPAPHIELFQPGQIEFMEEAPAAAAKPSDP